MGANSEFEFQSSKNSSRSTKKSSLHVSTRSPAKKPPKNARVPKSSSRLTVHVSRDLLDDSDSGTANVSRKRKGGAVSAKVHLTSKRAHLSGEVRARSSPRRKEAEKVFIPGERTSPRKRKGRGDREKRAESGVRAAAVQGEDGEDLNESSVKLDDDTFQKVRYSRTSHI